jgi:peptidase M15-like protein
MVDINKRLSKNFTLGEFLRSATAERHEKIVEQQYNPPQEVIANLTYLCTQTLQPIRELLGAPMKITSGYRCKLLNDLVGSSDRSQHLKGQAADVQMSASFLKNTAYLKAKNRIRERVKSLTGNEIRGDVNSNFYLFSYICIRLEGLDIDQVIHEYGSGLGNPGWVHVSNSPGDRDKRQILALGRYLDAGKDLPDLIKALNYGT